jgi:hypothetical protein
LALPDEEWQLRVADNRILIAAWAFLVTYRETSYKPTSQDQTTPRGHRPE